MSADWPVIRGQVVRADIGLDEPKLFVVVSNNRRNRALDEVLCVRVTTARTPPLPSIVELPRGEPVRGRVCCDDIGPVYRDEIVGVIGALSARTMSAVAEGLRAALDLRD